MPGMPRRPRRLVASLLTLAALGVGADARAEAVDDTPLTPAGIYARAIRNLMESAILSLQIESADAAGNVQHYTVEMMWRRYPEGTPEATEGVLSRAVARYLTPRDLRQSSVLVVNRRDRSDEQYVYLRSQRRIRRMNLSGQNVFGTDFAVEDLVPRGLFHADYVRLEDETLEGTPCFRIEARFKPDAESYYSRGLFYVDQANFVPLRVRYWDRAGVEVKTLDVDRAGIRQIAGLHIPTRMVVHNLQTDSHTELRITDLVPNPAIPESYFSVRHLEAHATGGLPSRYYADAHRIAD